MRTFLHSALKKSKSVPASSTRVSVPSSSPTHSHTIEAENASIETDDQNIADGETDAVGASSVHEITASTVIEAEQGHDKTSSQQQTQRLVGDVSKQTSSAEARQESAMSGPSTQTAEETKHQLAYRLSEYEYSYEDIYYGRPGPQYAEYERNLQRLREVEGRLAAIFSASEARADEHLEVRQGLEDERNQLKRDIDRLGKIVWGGRGP